MALEDAGDNPAKLAQALLAQLDDVRPGLPVREIAAALDIYEIREAHLDGFEGALITKPTKTEGSILVRVDRRETRKRFTIAHELGHYLNGRHTLTAPDGFYCTQADFTADRFRPNDFRTLMEAQANEFAAELLMPPNLIRAHLKRSAGVDIEQIIGVADAFEVSREAAARRYVSFAKEPVAVVFGKEGRVRYCKRSDTFPRLDVNPGDPLPISSPKKAGEISEWYERPAGVWTSREACHQVLPQANGFSLVLVALTDSNDGDDDA